MPSAVLHLSLTPLEQSSVELHYWRDDPNQFTLRTLPLAEIANFARESEADYYSVSAPDLVDVGRGFIVGSMGRIAGWRAS